MCGIVGVAGNLGYKDKNMLHDMLICATVRGEDSAGFFSVGKGASRPVKVVKTVGTSFDLFNTTGWDRLGMHNEAVVIGHTRKATIGAVKKCTAHPFNYDHITGVHNGTLTNWRALPGDSEETDSATLYKNIAANGARETIEAADGAYALIWYDEQTNRVHVTRNKERSLWYAFNADGDVIYWASEPWMITINAGRHDIKLQDLTPKEKYVTSVALVPEDVLWTIELGTGKETLTFREDEKLEGGTNLPVVATFHSYSNNYYAGGAGGSRRVPFEWEKRAQELRVQRSQNSNNRENTKTAVASSTTSSSSAADAEKTASTSSRNVLDFRQKKPLLALPAASKSDTSDESKAKLNDSIKELFGIDVGDVEPTLTHYDGDTTIDAEEFDALVDPNCLCCAVPYSFEQLLEQAKSDVPFEWVDEDKFVCSSCLVHHGNHKMAKGA